MTIRRAPQPRPSACPRRRIAGSPWRRAAVALAFVGTVGTTLPVRAATEPAPDDAPPITPYRPTVSNPAQLPAAGQLELELGGLRQRSADTRRDSLPYLLKYAWSVEWGLLVGGEGWIRERDPDGRASGIGDTTFVLKRAWTVDDATAFGLEAGATLPTAGSRLGSGRPDVSLNGILSRDIGPVHLDTNLNLKRLGRPEDGASRWQTGASAALAMPLLKSAGQTLGATVELSGTRAGGAAGSRQWLGALTWSPNPRLAFDLGVARAPRPSPGATAWFAGVVVPLGRRE